MFLNQKEKKKITSTYQILKSNRNPCPEMPFLKRKKRNISDIPKLKGIKNMPSTSDALVIIYNKLLLISCRACA